jgi:hypothetical protein
VRHGAKIRGTRIPRGVYNKPVVLLPCESEAGRSCLLVCKRASKACKFS